MKTRKPWEVCYEALSLFFAAMLAAVMYWLLRFFSGLGFCLALLFTPALADSPLTEGTARVNVDWLEVNHVCNPQTGQVMHSQYIGWVWGDRGPEVCFWMNATRASVWPSNARGAKLVFWDLNRLYVATASHSRILVTCTPYDRELRDRATTPKDWRREWWRR